MAVEDNTAAGSNLGAIRSLNFIAGLKPGVEQVHCKGRRSELIVEGDFHEHVGEKFDLTVRGDRGELVIGESTLSRWGGERSDFYQEASTVYEQRSFAYEYVNVTEVIPHHEKKYHFGDRDVFRRGWESRTIHGSETTRAYGTATTVSDGLALNLAAVAQVSAKLGVNTVETVNGGNVLVGWPLHIQLRPSAEMNFNTFSQVIARQEGLLSIFRLEAGLAKLGGRLSDLESKGAIFRFFGFCARSFVAPVLGAIRIPK